jgi:hypothetical protein
MMAWRGGKRPNPAKETVLTIARKMAERWRNDPLRSATATTP